MRMLNEAPFSRLEGRKRTLAAIRPLVAPAAAYSIHQRIRKGDETSRPTAHSYKSSLPVIPEDIRIYSSLNKGRAKPGSLKPQTTHSQSPDYNLPSSPTKRMNRSSHDNDSPASPQKRPRDQSAPSRHSSSSSNEGDPARNISKLFWGLIEFWLLVQGERSWPFTIVPASSKVTKLEDTNPEQDSTAKSEGKMNLPSHQTEEIPSPVPIDLPAESEASDVKDEQDYWDEMRLQLGRQRHQLYLWKIGSSDSDLDGLLESKSDIHRKLGRSILLALLRIALAITVVIDLQRAGEQSHDSRHTSLLQESERKLRKLIGDGYRGYNFKQREITLMLYNPTGQWSPPELLATIQPEIDKLLKLRDQIGRAVADSRA
ncbi:hypothetical protein FHL15_004946 [Xylaria flabelliformis]|uniref:Uncharacterized protein n=1 Tax=Xylaria flabelliformis TaxID=2512241 RepID=A0A553I1V3_9PEZI|nr:hypothetical protein FHL15_004946 [Xylaria flabelliformis]